MSSRCRTTTQQPLPDPSLADRAVRRKKTVITNAGWTRTEKGDANDNPRPLIAQLAMIRAEKAKLQGYPNYARLCAV